MLPDLPVGKGKVSTVLPLSPSPSPGTFPPGTVQKARVGVFIDATLQRLEPCLHHYKGHMH